jgi:hypothetical protein
LTQNIFIHESEAEKLFQLLADPMKDVTDFHIVAKDVMHVEWLHKTSFSPVDPKSNIFIATFTTCYARLELYALLEKLQRRVLYFDTDSVILVSKPGFFEPSLGDYLGNLTSEIGDNYIVEFASTGPKSYAYRLDDGSEVCKVKGFTLNYKNSQLINFEAVKGIVMEPSQKITTVNLAKITRHKHKAILYNRKEQKDYGMVYTKRVIQDDLTTLPYGY